MTGKHQRRWSFEDVQASTIDVELNREMDEYLDQYGDEGPVDGLKQLPRRGGRHARKDEQ